MSLRPFVVRSGRAPARASLGLALLLIDLALLDGGGEGSPTWLADGRIIFVQDGNVYVMAAQRGADETLLADVAYRVRHTWPRLERSSPPRPHDGDVRTEPSTS